MKNRKIKTVFLGIAACAAFIAGAALCSVNGVSGYRNANGAGNVQVYAAESESGASANESANAAFRMLGASVRLAEDEKNGIRFVKRRNRSARKKRKFPIFGGRIKRTKTNT